MMARSLRTLFVCALVGAAMLTVADTPAPTQLEFLGTASIFGLNKHDKSGLLRQSDCSITQYSFYPLLALTSTTNFQNTLHNLANLTTTANKFPSGCKDPTRGIASTAVGWLGLDTGGVYQAVHGSIASSADLVVNGFNPKTLAATSTTLATNVTPQVIAVDLNGDGAIDIVATGVTSPGNQVGVGVFINNGDGSFKAAVVYPLTTAANAAFIVDDANGDGIPDIIVPNTSAGGSYQLTTLLGKGDGSFTVGPSSAIAAVSSNQTSQTLVTGAFHGNGKIDVLMADGNLYPGNGDGSFGAGAQVLPGNSFTQGDNSAFAVGDFNGDGKLDLAQEISCFPCAPEGGIVQIYLGNGDGAFTANGAYEVVTEPAALVATDIDGDGQTDLVVGRESNGAFGAAGNSWYYQVLMGYGNGRFNAAPLTLVGAFHSGGNGALGSVSQWPATNIYATADFNGDGTPDLLQPQPSSSNAGGSTLAGLTISTGRGDGSFANPNAIAINFIPVIVAAGDLNGDGKPDAVAVGTDSAGDNFVGVLFGNGGAGLGGELDYALPASIGTPVGALIGDFNGDGHPDIAVALRGVFCAPCATGVYVLYGQANHSFAAPVSVDTSLQPIIASADLNGDGRADLVVIDAGVGASNTSIPVGPGMVHVYLGNANSGFAASSVTVPAVYFSDLKLADLNNDGKTDIVAGATQGVLNNEGGNTEVLALLGHGDGTFGAALVTTITNGGADPAPPIAVGDFNGDGYPDVAFFLPGDFSGVLFGNGTGNFPNQVNMTLFSPALPGAATALDLNGDKKPDLLVADYDEDGIVSFINQWGVASSLAATTTTLTSSANSVGAGQALTLTAVVAASVGGGATPSGNVSFLDGTMALGSGALDGSGKATFTTSTLAAGSQSLSAVYGGSSTYAGSASAALTVDVTAAAPDFSASVAPTSVSVAAGSSATAVLTVSPVNGSTQTVAVACSGLPAHATCGFSPSATVTLDGTQPSTVTVTFSTDVTAALSRIRALPMLANLGGGFGGGVLTLLALGACVRGRLRRPLLLSAVALALASCHGGSGSGGGGGGGSTTPSGSYPITISLTSGSTTHSVSLTLVVS